MNPFFELLTPRQKSLLAAAASAQLMKVPARHWPPEDFLHALCDALGIPAMPISAENVDLASYKRHRQLCAKFQFLPLFESGVVIQIASVQPWNEAWLMELRGWLEKEIHALGVLKPISSKRSPQRRADWIWRSETNQPSHCRFATAMDRLAD